MGFLHNLKFWLSPPKMTDPDFGNLTFMHIGKHPERSYWECEWAFPPSGTVIEITLNGGESGPIMTHDSFTSVCLRGSIQS